MLDVDAHAPASHPHARHGEAVDRAFVAQVEAAVAASDAAALRDLVEDLHEADLGSLIEALGHDARPRLIELLGRDFDFAALTEIDDAVREDILDELESRTLAEGVAELDTDDAVYILEDLEPEERARILGQLTASERSALARSLDYPEDSAGRRMQTETVAVPPHWSVGDAIDFMRASDELPDTFYEILVVAADQRLVGTVALDRLLRAKRPVPMADLMREDLRTVLASERVEEVAHAFQRYNLVSAPVVDEEGRLVGVLTVDDMLDVLEEEVDEDLRALGGLKPDEELSDTVWYTVRARFPWLFANLLTAILASGVIGMFAGALEKMVALAVLMPIVASMGGNAGTQTMTVAVRALATRELSGGNIGRVIRREGAVGLLNGVAFALIMGFVASAWFRTADIGFVIALAFVTVLTAAALGGILIPLALNRLGVDPAVSSGPFVTTITDVVGFFSFLGIATLWFGLQ